MRKTSKKPYLFKRRDLLKGAMILPGALVSASFATSEQKRTKVSQANQPDRSQIRVENERPGTRDWQLTRARINQGKFRTSLIEGYCSHQSILVGQTLNIFVSTDPERQFTLDIYRMGYYGGTGGRLMTTIGPLRGSTQNVPEMTPAPARLRQCQWVPSVELKIPADWLSGVYLGKLTTIPDARSDPYWQSYVVFIVRTIDPRIFCSSAVTTHGRPTTAGRPMSRSTHILTEPTRRTWPSASTDLMACTHRFSMQPYQ